MLPGQHLPNHLNSRSHSLGPVVASRAIVPLLKIQRTMDQAAVFMVSGRLDGENVRELCQSIDAEPPGTPVVVDLTDLVLADRDAIRYLRDCESGDRVVLRNCPEYVRVWMSADESP
jgi:hypothetical protein